MHYLRKNPKANPNNMLKFLKVHDLCCGDEDKLISCRYDVTIDVSGASAATQLKLGDTAYVLTAVVTGGANLDTLQAEIEKALIAGGYNQDGLQLDYASPNLTIKSSWGTAVFTSITIAGTEHFFEALKCTDTERIIESSFPFRNTCGIYVKINAGADQSPTNGRYALTLGTSYDFDFPATSEDSGAVKSARLIESTDPYETDESLITDLTAHISSGVLTRSGTQMGLSNGDDALIEIVGTNGCIAYIRTVWAT